MKDGRVAKNVARAADGTGRKHSNKTRRYLNHEEVIRFAQAAETDVQATLLKTPCEGKGQDDPLFADRAGGFMRRPKASNGSRSWFVSALAEARLERLTPHDLRHTAASLAVSSGANIKAVQRMLGHKSAAMTLDTYADLFDDDLDAVAMRLDESGREKNVGKVRARRDLPE